MSSVRKPFGSVLLALISIALISGTGQAQTETDVTAEWNPPATGTPVNYVLQLSKDNGPWSTIANPGTTSHTFTVSAESSYRIRVAAVDADGVQGPYSLPSPPYPENLMGKPGRPDWVR